MLSSKHINKITMALICLALIFCVVAMVFQDKITLSVSNNAYNMQYADKLFDTSQIIDINIAMDESSWNEMLENAIDETYYECDVTINGTTFNKVGIRTKGNTSLSSIANDPDTDRYSFKLEFDHYIEGQTCFGLDKLVLNNNYADTTNMKEALIYDMFKFLDTNASLYNYAKISVNNDYWGVYLALEAVEESFILRNYGTANGYLYKPDNMEHGGKPENKSADNKEQKNAHSQNDFSKNDKNNFKGGGRSSGGANLNYTDDDYDSYSSIWSSAVNTSKKSDHKRVITALKNIHEGNDIEKYIDIEQVLKYMAVHNFAVNEDSLSGSMAHNYYLYESNGKISILPWDYNLSFGGMNSKSGTDVINTPIDDKYSSTELFDFVLENDEYKAKYHEYYNKLVEEYLSDGKFEKRYNEIRSQIDNLVKSDPNALQTYEEYTTAAQLLYETVNLRTQSVKQQLEGNIPSTKEGQKADSASLIDGSHINISDMGNFMGGGNNPMHGKRGNFPENMRNFDTQSEVKQ